MNHMLDTSNWDMRSVGIWYDPFMVARKYAGRWVLDVPPGRTYGYFDTLEVTAMAAHLITCHTQREPHGLNPEVVALLADACPEIARMAIQVCEGCARANGRCDKHRIAEEATT